MSPNYMFRSRDIGVFAVSEKNLNLYFMFGVNNRIEHLVTTL